MIDQKEINWVYITHTGKKYYGRSDAGMLRGNGAPVPITSAEQLGYEKASRGY